MINGFYLPHIISDQRFKGTLVNEALLSLHENSYIIPIISSIFP